MNLELYINHVGETLKELTDRNFDLESNFNLGKGKNCDITNEFWDTVSPDLHFVLTLYPGQNYGKVDSISFNLSCDCDASLVNEVVEIFSQYQKQAYNKKITIEQYDIVENLSTPYIENAAMSLDASIGSRVAVTGEVVIGENLASLKKVKVNGVEVDYISTSEIYTATPNLQPNEEGISRGLNTVATYQLSLSILNTNDSISTLIRRVIHFKESMNKKFAINLIYTNEDEFLEDYILISCSIEHTKTNVPIYNLTFALGGVIEDGE